MRSFDERVQTVLSHVRAVSESFTEPDEDWRPIVHLYDAEDKITLALLVGFEKYMWPDVIKALVRKTQAEFAGMVLSSWTMKTPPEKWPAVQAYLDAGGTLSEHPDRKEVVLVSFADRGHQQVWEAEIIRYEDRPPTLGEWSLMPDADEIKGELFTMMIDAFAAGGVQ